MKLSTKIILSIILISALLILLTGCFGVPTDESPGITTVPGTITGIIASPCCTTSAEPVSKTCCIAPEFWCFYCQNTWNLQDGIEVVLTYGEDEVATTTTNEFGEFTFTNVSPGKNYVVTAYCPDFDDNRPLVKDVALELIEGGSFDTKITDLVSTSLGLVVDFLVVYTELGPEDIILEGVIVDKPNFPNFPKFKKLVYEVRRVLENCEVNMLTDDDVQDALCRTAEEITGLDMGCAPAYTPPPPPPPTPTYTVTFDSQGGSEVDSQTVLHGGKVTEPTAPTKEGCAFGGWYKELEYINVWDFNTDTVTSDVTLYAKWMPVHNLTKDTYYYTIQAALDDTMSINRTAGPTPASDIIEVADGTYNESITFPSDKVVLLRSLNGASSTTITGVDGFATVTFSSSLGGTTLEGFTINHESGDTGRGITITDGYLNINNSITSGNTANSATDYDGGGIYNDHGDLTITGCTISGNTATNSDGGGIYNGLGTSTITSSIISSNSAADYGGGICIYDNSPTPSIKTIQNNTISGNTASISGGGIYIESGSPTIGGETAGDTSDFNTICGNTPDQIDPDSYPNNYISTHCVSIVSENVTLKVVN